MWRGLKQTRNYFRLSTLYYFCFTASTLFESLTWQNEHCDRNQTIWPLTLFSKSNSQSMNSKTTIQSSDLPALTIGWSFSAHAAALTKADMKPSLIPCFFWKAVWYWARRSLALLKKQNKTKTTRNQWENMVSMTLLRICNDLLLTQTSF